MSNISDPTTQQNAVSMLGHAASQLTAENEQLRQQLAEANERATKAEADAAIYHKALKDFIEIECYWRRVYIGHALMQATPTLTDERLGEYRDLIAKR